MSFCPTCGGQLSPGAAACPACNTQQLSAAPSPLMPLNGAEASGFIAALFDLSFTTFITSKLIKVLYVLGIAGAGVWALVMAVGGIGQGGVGWLLALAAPVLFLVGVIYMRVMMELIMVIFRSAEHLTEIARQGRR